MKPESSQGLLRVFEEQRAPLSNYFLKRTAHTWDAQDLLQEVYLRLLTVDRSDAAAIRNPEAYLYTVAANLVKQHAVMKRNTPVSSHGLEDILDRLATPCDAAADVDRERRRERLGKLIGRLSPKCRAVLVMHYRDELGYREIGERLQISTHMVKKYIVKALTACRQGLACHE